MADLVTTVSDQLLRGSVSVALAGPLGVVGRENAYTSNNLISGLPAIPTPEVLSQLYWSGRIDYSDLTNMLKRQGINWNGISLNADNSWSLNSSYISRHGAWWQWWNLSRPLPPISYYLSRYRLTGLDADQSALRQRMARDGISAQAEQDLIINQPFRIPDQHLGMAFNRGLINAIQFDRQLQYAGYIDPFYRQIYGYLMTNEIPSPSDLIQFGVKDAWDMEVVSALGYDRDYPAPLEYYLRQQGLKDSVDVVGADGTLYPATPWARLFWRQHWRNIAPGQWFDMMRQNTPRRIAQLPAPLNAIRPTVLADVIRGLKIADYPPAVRDQIAALAFRTLPVRYVSRLAQNHQITVDLATQLYQELGYVPQDARTLAVADRHTEAVQYRKRIRAQLRACALEQYEIGIIDSAGATQALQSTGLPPHTIEEAITVVQCGVSAKTAKATIKAIRSKFLRGYYTLDDAAQQLGVLGVTQERRGEYIALWQIENTPRRKEFTTAQIITNAEAGIIPIAQAVKRLANLGWNNPDLLVLAAKINAGISAAQSRAEKAMERQQAQQAAALQRAANHAKALARQAVAALRRAEPLSFLKKAYAAGQISADTIASRMAAQDYSPEAIAIIVKNYGPKQQ
jgi:hypothetical protein